MAKKVYLGVPLQEIVSLPEGYTQLTYIESTGSQYIDTGVRGKSGVEAELSFEFTKITGSHVMLGAQYSSYIYLCYTTTSSSNGWTYIYGNSSTYTKVLPVVNTIYNVHAKLAANEQFLKVNGVTLASGTTATSYDSTYPLALFGRKTSSSSSERSYAKLYRCKIWESGSLVRNYIPAKNNSNVVGLYDLVTGTFYNANSGTFTAGAEVSTPSTANIIRPCNKIYLGVNSVAREMKSGYIGIDGIARKTFGIGSSASSTLTVPSQSVSLYYTGLPQAPTWKNYDSSVMTLGGTTKAINAGTYYATFTPNTGYSWSDGSTSSKSVSWRLNKATIDIGNVGECCFSSTAATNRLGYSYGDCTVEIKNIPVQFAPSLNNIRLVYAQFWDEDLEAYEYFTTCDFIKIESISTVSTSSYYDGALTLGTYRFNLGYISNDTYQNLYWCGSGIHVYIKLYLSDTTGNYNDIFISYNGSDYDGCRVDIRN